MPTRYFTFLMAVGLAAAVFGQEARETSTATIAGKTVTIEYGRPALKGRNLADLMKQIPADRIWRAGAGAITTLAAGADLLIGGKKVPAGKYSLYLYCPENGDYALLVNRDLGQPLGKLNPRATPDRVNQPYPHFNYSGEIADQEVARVPMKQITVPRTDLLTYTFEAEGDESVLTLSWGEQAWTAELRPAN